MTTPTPPDAAPREGAAPDRATGWAKPVSSLEAPHAPADAINLNVTGRQLTGPLQGFGPLWQKTYRIRLSGAAITPTELVRLWKEQFPSFWPPGNRFCAPLTGIAPGEVALLNLAMPGSQRVQLSTGVMVIYADDEAFTFMTPAGHMFAGWITFSAAAEDGVTVAQVQVLLRSNDPLWEIVMRLFGFQVEDEFWHATLTNLAARVGVAGVVQQRSTCLDPRMQWSRAGNLRYNAAIRSMVYYLRAPARLFRSPSAPSAPAVPAVPPPAEGVPATPATEASPTVAEPAAGQPDASGTWARPVKTLSVAAVPPGAVNLNVEGRPLVGPLQGFGPLWQKTFRVRLPGVTATPAEVIRLWKEHFPEFLPPTSRFYPSITGVQPGEVVLINAAVSGLPVYTGVLVLYADDESFTLMTANGLPEAGWNTFSASLEDGCTVAQIQTMARANDPVYEIGFRLFGSREQDQIWTHMLTALAARHGVSGQVSVYKTCLDPAFQWSRLGNVRYNAALRSLAYLALTPLRVVGARASRLLRPARPASQ